MKPSERHRRDADLLQEFLVLYADLLNSTTPHQELFLAKLIPAIPLEEWSKKQVAVASAAGAAGAAFDRWGTHSMARNAAFVTGPFSIMDNWDFPLSSPEEMSTAQALALVQTAESAARTAADEAADRERGLTGLVAAFVRWPQNVREAVGPGHPAQQRAGFLIGVVGQVIATLVVTGVLALLGYVTHRLVADSDHQQPRPGPSSSTSATMTP